MHSSAQIPIGSMCVCFCVHAARLVWCVPCVYVHMRVCVCVYRGKPLLFDVSCFAGTPPWGDCVSLYMYVHGDVTSVVRVLGRPLNVCAHTPTTLGLCMYIGTHTNAMILFP